MNENNPLIFGKKKYEKTKPINSGMSTFWKLLLILALGLSAVSFALSMYNDGKTGFRGPVGERGQQGPPGLTGAVGAVGSPGLNGTDGTDGQDGEKGDDGIDGSIGADSIVPGPKGDTGSKGDDGADSIVPGPKGDTGSKGDDGADSIVPGPKGDTGAASIVPGPKGDTGAASIVPGPKGETGPPGPIDAVDWDVLPKCESVCLPDPDGCEPEDECPPDCSQTQLWNNTRCVPCANCHGVSETMMHFKKSN